MLRTVRWRMLDVPGQEVLQVSRGPQGVTAEGTVACDLGEGPITLRYRVECDPEFRFERAVLLLDEAGRQKSSEILREPNGWSVDGLGRPDLDGCAEIDIMVTPFTNTLPIRTQTFVPGQARRVRVAWVQVPDLSVTAAEQDYTQLGPAGRPGRFRFHAVESGFVAEMGVDADGIVIDYGEFWRRED